MQLAGKSAPETEQLEILPESLEYVEVYTERSHVKDTSSVRESVGKIENSDYEAVSVHIPRVVNDEEIMPEWRKYLRNTDEMAAELDALVVLDSPYMAQTDYAEVSEMLDSDYGLEHQAGISMEMIENNILEHPNKEDGFKYVFDTAHLYVAHPSDYMRKTEQLANHPQTSLIHLNDATEQQDGKAFGEGKMDMQAVYSIIDESDFEGPVVLEVDPRNGEQHEALEKVEKWRNERLDSVEGRELC